MSYELSTMNQPLKDVKSYLYIYYRQNKHPILAEENRKSLFNITRGPNKD